MRRPATPGLRHESTSPGVCQCCAMGIPGICRPPVGEGNFESAVRSLIEWMGDGEAEARRYLADRAEPMGASLVAAHDHDVIGYAAIVRESNYAGFRSRSIPLVHQIAVAGPFRRRGVATLGITVGLFDEYGPAQRLYGRRGYIPDGRGACQGQRPLRKGMLVTMNDDLLTSLTERSRQLTPHAASQRSDEDIGLVSPIGPENRRWLASVGRYGMLDVVPCA